MNDASSRSGEKTMTVEEAIRGRKSTRAFLQTPVPRELMARILDDRRARAVGLEHPAVESLRRRRRCA